MSELDALRDRESVIEVVNNLFVAVDNRDWEAARACFAERVLFDMSSAGGPAPSEVEAEQIVAGWEAGLAPIEAVHHQSGNFRVRVTVDEAECFCYGTAYHYRRGTRVPVKNLFDDLEAGDTLEELRPCIGAVTLLGAGTA